MASNRGVVYVGPGKVEVRPIDFPKLSLGSRKCEHGVILKVVSTNICGSDQHMVRGRATASAGMVLGHEITGEIIGSRCSRLTLVLNTPGPSAPRKRDILLKEKCDACESSQDAAQPG